MLPLLLFLSCDIVQANVVSAGCAVSRGPEINEVVGPTEQYSKIENIDAEGPGNA